METTKKLSLDDIFGKVSAPASSEAVKSIDDIFGQKEKVTPEAPYGTMTDEIRGVSHAPADLIGVSPQPAIIGEDELQKNRAGFEKELKSTAGAIQPTQESFKPMSADAFKVGGDVAMPGAIDKPKSLSQTVQSEINKRWGGDLQSIIDKARSVNPENVNLAEDMESHFWKVMKDKVPSDSFITQEDLDGFKFTRDYSNGDKDIEYSFGHYTYPQEVVNEYVARHNDEVLHNMRFKEEPEYRNEWFLRNVGVTEQAYWDEVAADLENRLQELRKKVVATLPAQHTRGGYAAIGAAANKPSSGASVSIEKIDKALKTVNTLLKNSFGAGLKEGFDLADILTLGVSGIGENVALLNALNKSASGKTLTTSEQALVEAWDIQNEAEEVMQVLGGRSLASNIGRGVAQSLGFITQTVGTGGLASAATKGITRAAAKSALKRVASTGVASKIQEGVRYGSLKAAESLVGAAARTPFMGFTYRNYTDKRLNQFQVNERVDEATGEISKYIDKQESSALRDAAHAALESYFESQSEDVGGLIDFGITSFARALPIKQFIRSSVVNGMTGAVKNGAMKWIKESAKIYGLAGEVLSEAYGDAAVNLLTSNTDGWKQMASSEYWWELLGVSSMLSGGFGVVNRAVNSYSGRNIDRQIAREDNNRRNALSRIEDDMLKKELTEVSLTDDLIERSKMLSSLDWSNFTKEDMANTIDFISAQTRLDVMRESDMESRRLARIMPAIDEVKTLADNGALDEDQAAASLAVIYSDLFRTQENQRALNILTDRIKVAADAGISADEINEILRGAGLTVFNPGDEIETLTGDRAIVDKVLPGAYEVVNNEGDRAVVSFEEVLQNTPEVRQIQQESNQNEGQPESAPENNPQVEQAVADARAQVAEIINKDDSTVYEVETDDGITGYIIGGKGIVVDSDGRINQSAEDTVVVKTDEGNRVVHKERVKVKNRQTLQEIEDLARGAAEGALAAVQPQQPVGGKTYQGLYDNEPVTITLPREIKFNEDGTVDYDNLMNPETVSVIRPNGAVVDEVGLNEIEQLTEVQPEAEQVSADAPAVKQQEVTNLEPDFSAIRPVSIGDFGPIYDQFRGNAKDAIALLLQRKDGEAVGALSHPEVGEIDLVWGREGTSKSDGYGLSKLAKYHPEVLENLQEILNDMKVASRTENRVQLESDTHKASVRLTWNEQKKNWLLTAFEKKEASASIGKKTDTDDNPKDLRGDTALSQNTDALSDNKDTTSEPNNQEVAQKNVTETAHIVQQPQIPLLKNGEPDYNAMDAQMFAEQYVARFGEDMTERVARNNIKASNKAISTIEKQIEDVTDPNKMPALYSKLQEAQATKDKYSAVLEELGLSADESEDNAARIQRKKQENTPWFNKLFPDGFPNVESVILWDIANGNRIRWTNKEVNGAVVSKGLGSHLGLADSNSERTRRVALIGKDAPTPEEYAEQLPERLNAMGIRFEESELLDKVLDVYASVDTVRKAKEELEKISANIQAEQEGLDYEEEQMRRNYEREQEALRQEAQADVVDEQTEQEQPTNEETQEEELSTEDEVPFMVSSDSVQATTEAHKLATEAAITALEDAGVEVVNATPEMVEEALQRKDVQMQSVNQKFNEQLDSFTEENATSVVFDLGMPSPILLAGGVADKPIKLYGNKLLKKIRKHGLNLEELKGLPIAIANPIAIFDNYRKSGNRSVLTELKTKDGNILVSIEIGKGVDIDFDMVKSVFGKDDNGVLNWINKGYLTFVDKEKALGYLYPSAPIAATANSQELDSATKIVENFENPNFAPANSFAVENPSLVGLHNISEEKLRKAFRLGGLANPSVAVIDSNSQKHTGYGDITLVLPSAMIAKKTGKNIGTYFGDAWTPTYPEVQKQLGNNRASQDIMELPDEMQNSVRLALNSWLDGRSGDSLSYMFLHQRGDAPEIHRTQAEFSPELHEAMTQITGGQDFYYLNDEARNRVLDLYIQEKHDGSRDKFNAHMRRVIERGNRLIEERGENSLIGRKAKEAIDAINEYGYDYDSVSGFVRDVHRDMEYSGKVDPQYTLLLAERKVKENGLESAFAQWLDSLEDRYAIKEVIFKGYTPSGNRRYIPNTLENASKEMRLQGRAGAAGLSIGFSNFAARLLQPGVTLDDIRKRKRQLKTSIEEVDAFKDKWSSVMFDLGEKCQPNATGYEDYGLERLAEAATKNDPQAYLKSEYGVDLSDEDVKRLKDMVKAIRTEYPVMYFETKFERPVYFNEFAGAVVPDNTSADVVQSLKDAGIPVWTYAASDENARMDAIKNIANSSNDIFFSIGPAPVFVSNAKIAVLGIKQEKATPEQWLKMIEKAGGLKAGEDKWIGLSDWLKASDKKTLTKQEVLDYINENQIQIEETTYSSNSAVERTPEFKALQEEFKQLVKSYEDEAQRNLDEYEAKLEKKYNFTDTFDTTVLNSDESKAHSSLSRAVGEAYNAAWVDLVDRYGDDFEIAFWRGYDGIRVDNAEAAGILLGLPIDRPIYHIREDYATNGLEGNREIALTVPNIESWRETDEIHFGDAGDGRAIAWVRFGETTDSDGKRVLVIDEVQSKRHQEGREKGYISGDIKAGRAAAKKRLREAYDAAQEYRETLKEKYNWDGIEANSFSEHVQKFTALLTPEEIAERERLDEEKRKADEEWDKYDRVTGAVPEAPFEKNWAELAMKRMLRYAAENGFDKVAWTKGNQQAGRYNIGSVVDKIVSYTEDGAKTVRIYLKNNEPLNLKVDSEGKILYSNRLTVSAGQNLSDVVGKDVAVKILRGDGEDATIYAGKGKEYAAKQLSGNNLRIGGEGMRAFYDQMLPSFMNKYGKKWGVEVQDVTLPYVEEAGRTMHSVDVTDSMRESVMQGQPMFYRRPNGTVYGWTNGTTVYLTESGMNPNTPIHEYTHIWADAMRKHNPEGWASIVKLLKGTPIWNEVMDDTNYANIHSDEHTVASEALSRISGRENSAKMEAMAQLMIDENANDTVKKNRARKLLDRMRKALQEFWSWVGKELFGIKNFESVEQVTDRILYDLVSGTDLAATPSLAGQVKAVIDEYDNADEIFTINDVAARISEVVNNYIGTESTTELENILEDFEEAQNSAGRYGYRMDSGGEDAFEDALRSYAANAPIGGFSIQPQERAEIIRAAKANGTYLKAPNGKDTNLTSEQWVTVRTKAFKRWFGDWENDPENASKVVDENGEPKVVYHQTNAKVYINRETGQNWDELDWRERMEWDERDDWDDYWIEQDFTKFSRVNARVTQEFDGFFFAPEYDEHHEYGNRTIAAFLNIRKPASREDYNIDSTQTNAGREERLRLQSEGFDGVIREYDGAIDEYIAFYPNQIKLAEGNTTFDPDNDDVRFSIERDNESKEDFSFVEHKVTPLARLEAERDAMLENRENNPNFEQEYEAIESRIREEKETDRVALTVADGLESEVHRVAVEDAVFDYVREHNLFASQVYVERNLVDFKNRITQTFPGADVSKISDLSAGFYSDGIIVLRSDMCDKRTYAEAVLIHEYTHALTTDLLDDDSYYERQLAIAKEVGADYMIERLYPNYKRLEIEKSDDGLVAGLMEMLARDMEFVVRNGRLTTFLSSESESDAVLREYFERYEVPTPLAESLINIAKQIKTEKYGEEIDRRTHSEGEFVSTDTEWDNGTNLQPNARTDGERRYPGWFGTRTGATGTASDEGGQVGGGTRGDRANLAESNQTAKSDSRARLIAELRQKLRDVKAETRTVAAEVGKIVRKAITAELIDKMGKRTFDNIVRTIETATVRRDVEYAVNRIEEAVLDMELRDKQDKFDKYLNLRVQGESARGVSIAANVTDQVRQFITIIRDNLDRPASEVEALIEERGGSLAERTGLQVLGFYQDARNFEREVQEIEDEIEKIKSENTELRKKRAALNKAGKTNDAKNLSDQINANKETIEHLNSERISTKRSQLYYIDMAANELEREIAYGKEGHKEWLQQEAERKQELIEIVWNDIGDGKDIPILDEQEPIWKKTKNAVVDYLLAPAYSWDYLLKMISVNAPNGEGALYDHFMRSENGYVAASGNYYQAYEDFKARLNEKAKDIFGKDYKQVLKDSNQPLDVTIQISAQGAFEIYTPTIGEVVYAYMAAKMPDGRVKLDKMGVKEDIIDSLVRQIPQGYITFADWVQNEFLPERRKVYNKTHLEVFGTQMAQIENYVPLKVKKDFVYEEFDGSKIDKAELPSSITGSIIKRKRNSLPIDLHTNIFDLLLDHGQQMEHWNAYTRIVRDTNQFLSNTKIRRALDYRKKGLHKKLKEASLIASNRYQPDVDRLEKMTVALSKMAASSKIAFRINTAIKQVLSYPAFYAYVADAHFWGYLTRNLGPDSWGRNFRWALDNIPSFQERWLGRMAGDDRLAQMTSPQLDRWIKGMGNVGMLPNALVDAVTCANGAQAVYRYEHERYLKIGLDESEADRLAKIAAAQALNQTQQSSEGMYLSRIQADRTAFAVAISTFQNSNFAYLRKELEGIDQLMRDTKKQIDNREKYYKQQGVNPDQAAKLALQDVVSANRTAVVKILVFGFILNTIWTLGNSVWKYAFGDDDEEDKWEDAAIRGFFNSFTRNLSVGQYVETVAWSDFRELNPSLLLSDLNMFIERLESIAEGNVKMWDRTAAWTVLSTLSSLGLGVDINSFASMCESVQGAIDNGANVEDIMLLVNAPRSQAKFIAGPPKEGETLDEYTKRQAWIERKIVSRIDKKQLDKWSRNYEAYKQAEMLGVPYSRDKMGRVSVPYIKDIDDSYSALLKSVGRTKSGAKRNDGDSIADDVKTRIRDFGLIKRIKDINALEKNLDAMVILDGAYPERLKELCEAKQQLIEEWNQ